LSLKRFTRAFQAKSAVGGTQCPAIASATAVPGFGLSQA
jgi:hypothetical protein